MTTNNSEIYTQILVVLLVFFIIIFLYVGYNCLNETFQEYFGSGCVDFIPFNSTPNYSKKPGAIFVSVASYRDDECSMTLETIYNNAKNPENIFVGICEQNKKGEIKENCVGPSMHKWRKNIRIKRIDYKDAKGPTFARYWCSKLWEGEEYFLQIDSHTNFIKDWDYKLIKMIEECRWNPQKTKKHPYGPEGSKLPILSVYPPTKEQMELKGQPMMDNGKLGKNKIPVFLAGFMSKSFSYPQRSFKPWAAAGFMFMDSTFMYNVQFDPNLSHLFQGEETLFSARLFTNGYDFFSPNENVCYHHYSRKKAPLYWNDIPNHSECRAKAEKRVLFLLGLSNQSNVADEFLKDLHKYGLGKFRKIQDFWKASGIDLKKSGEDGVEHWGNGRKVSKQFQGWNFHISGYSKIKKY